MRLPSIYLKLSELLPSKNRLKRTGKPWAKDIVKLSFQGLESSPVEALQTPPSKNQQVLPPSTPGPNAVDSVKKLTEEDSFVILTEARIIVPIPSSLSILKERLDEDIAFHAESGTFAFRLRSTVGESIIPALVERAARIERLVEFVEVLHKHEKTLRCESISLGKIVLSYGSLARTTLEATNGNGAEPLQYKGIVDFGVAANTMTLSFERGNPHLLIADRLAKVLNEEQGLDGVAHLLPLTLPTLRGLDAIQEAWTPLSDKGEVLVFVRAADWYHVVYNLFLTPAQTSLQPSPRKITFDLKLQHRKGEPWWFIRRVDHRDKQGDDIDVLLKPIWNSSGDGYRGMRLNAVAQPKGVEELLEKLDGVLRGIASAQKTAQGTQGQVPGQAPKQVAPVAPMSSVPAKASNRPTLNTSKQQRQQPTPTQTQSQGMGYLSTEIVEID